VDGEEQNFKAAILLQKPTSLRVELYNFLFQPFQFLLTNEKEFMVYVPGRAKALVGAPVSLNVYRFLHMRMELPELVCLLLGQVDWPAEGSSLRLFHLPQEDVYVLELCTPQEGCPYRVFLDPYTLRIQRLIRSDTQTQRYWEVKWSGFVSLGGDEIPTQVELIRPQERVRLKLTYNTPEIGMDLGAENFHLELPPDVELIQLDEPHVAD